MSWCLIGNFNELAGPFEKRGGQQHSISKFMRLNNFMDTINTLSIPVSGPVFTRKKWVHTHLIYERLDTTIGRNDWVNV